MSDPLADRGAPTEAVLYLTPGQVATMLRVSAKTVYRWASEDASMPTLRIGRVVRFPRARLEQWLRAREQGFGWPRRLQAVRSDEVAR